MVQQIGHKATNRTRWGDYIREEKLELISIKEVDKLLWEAIVNINVDHDVNEKQKEYAKSRLEYFRKRINDVESSTTVILRKTESQYPTISCHGDD